MVDVSLSEYSDDLLYRCFVWFIKNERHCRTSQSAREQRRSLLQLIIAACRFRDDLPDPAEFFRPRRLSRGVYTADDMRAFVMLVYDRMETLRDPERPQSEGEYRAELEQWRESFGRLDSEIEDTGEYTLTDTVRKTVAQSQKRRPRRARNVIRA